MPEGVRFTVDAFGDTQLERKILRYGERVGVTIALWDSLRRDLMLIERVQFLTEGGHGSGGWAELADSTVEEKARRRQPPWIERATNSLFKSLTEEGAEYQVFDRTMTWMRFGTSAPGASYQQMGTSKMPQRRIIELTEAERVLIMKKIQLFIFRGIIRNL